MNQYIGIVKGKPGWIHILEQEGVFYKPFEKGDEPAALIVDEYSGQPDITEYLIEGGFILTDAKTLALIDGRKAKTATLNYIVPDSSDFLNNVDIIDIHAKGCLIRESGYGKLNDRFPAVICSPHGRGTLIALPFDVNSAMLDSRSTMKFFYHAHGKFPAEHVSTVSKAEVRKLVVNALRYAFKRQGINYVHKWYYPEGKRSAFTFRIDTDTPVMKEIVDCFRIAEVNNLCFTFFIFTSPIENSISRLTELKDQEIAVHCYEHKVFRNPEKDFSNFITAKKQLENAGFDVSGLAIPYGSWNRLLGEITEKAGFAYSSDFSYSYDDLPSHPFLDKGFSTVLQIPVHPISPGSLLYVKNDGASIKAYYQDLIEKKLRNNDPLFFYGHSSVISHAHEIIEHILSVIREKSDIWIGTYQQFCDWWMQRSALDISHSTEKTIVRFQNAKTNTQQFIRIINPRGDEAIVGMKHSIDLKKLEFKKEKPPALFDRRRLGTKHGQLKLKLKEIENWIRR
jgi:hypothetical protein